MTGPDPSVANGVEVSDRGPARDGLTGEEAEARFGRFGPNEIPMGRRASWQRRFANQLLEPMSLLLIVVSAVEGFGLGERLEAFAILAIVILNAVIGTIQEGRAQRALDALRSMEPRFATVIRDGHRQRIELAGVVLGDVVVLVAGDRVPADVELLMANGLQIDESVLTGESLAVDKRVPRLAGDEEGRASAGTVVTNGEGLGVVVATGASSALGRIAAELGEARAPTPLQRRLRRLTKTLGLAAVGIASGVFVLTLVRLGTGEDQVRQAFLSAVALAVAAVPEGLPAVVTVVLALGVRRMAERGAIVRRLPAVETLGSSSVILTDKTGTLTENRMQVDRLVVPGATPVPAIVGSVPERLATAIALGSDATLDPPTGDPLEIALLEAVGDAQVRRIRDTQRRLGSLPFDPGRRRTVTVSEGTGAAIAVLKGAPEVVLAASVDAIDGDGARSPLAGDAVLRFAEELASSGSRVIAFAVREGPDVEPDRPPEEGFTLLGIVSLRDPVRAEAASAVADAASAGIRIVMVTGDHAGTAASVSREVGLLTPDGHILEGQQLGEADPADVSVFARVKPDDKLAIVRAFQDRGEVVAVTGDGVNDAPALRQADIGVAMGRTGSDVAREAADMVITDDDLGTIVHAVEEGRRLVRNIRNVIDYLVAGNLSEVAVVVTVLLLFPDSGATLTPLQILWINLLTDGLPAVALGVESGSWAHPHRVDTSSLLSWRRARMLGVRGMSIALMSVGTFVIVRFTFDQSFESARTAMFTVLVLSHLLYAFAVHLDRPAGTPAQIRSILAARGLLIAVGSGIVLQLAVVAVPVLHDVFDTTSLTGAGWLLCLSAGLVAPTGIWLAGRVGSRSAA